MLGNIEDSVTRDRDDRRLWRSNSDSKSTFGADREIPRAGTFFPSSNSPNQTTGTYLQPSVTWHSHSNYSKNKNVEWLLHLMRTVEWLFSGCHEYISSQRTCSIISSLQTHMNWNASPWHSFILHIHSNKTSTSII